MLPRDKDLLATSGLALAVAVFYAMVQAPPRRLLAAWMRFSVGPWIAMPATLALVIVWHFHERRPHH